MGLAAAPEAVEAADGQRGVILAPGAPVQLQHPALDAHHADARDAGRHVGEIFRHHGAREAQRLEEAAAAIAGDHGDAHLGHDLQQPLVEGLAIALQAILQRAGPEQAAAMAVGDAGLGHIGVDRGGADADQHAEVMHVQAFARAQIEGGEGAELLAQQMGMHRPGGEDHGDGRAARPRGLVGEDDMHGPAAHRILRLAADRLHRIAQRIVAAFGIEGAVHHRRALAHIGAHGLEFGGQQHRALQLEQPALALLLVQHIAQIAEAGLQRHHPALAQGIDGRVGDLAEVLAEEMMQAPILVGEHGQRRVVAHGAHGLLRLLHHGMEDHFQILHGEARGVMAARQLLPREDRGLARRVAHEAVDDGDVLDPVAEGGAARELVQQLARAVEPSLGEVDADHLAGADAALLHDGRLVDPHHAGFRARQQQPVAGDGVAHGAKPVAVHAGDDPIAGEGADRRRPVPGLHHRIAVAVEVAMGLGHGLAAGPDIGDQQRLHHGQVAPDAHQRLEDIVERRGIRAAGLHDGLHRLHLLAIDGRRHPRLMGLHPVEIALQRVDLAVMGDDAEGLGQMPGGEGVGGIALVIDREIRDEALVQQIGIEGRQLLRQEHALVDDRAAGEGADVEILDALLDHRLLDAPADQIEVDLELLLVHAAAVADHDLLDLGPGRIGLLADDVDVHRHLAPAIDRMAVGEDLALDHDAGALLGAEIGARQEHHADAELARPQHRAGAPDMVLEEILRDLHMDARPVAGLAVGIHGTAMPDRLQRRDRRRHHLPARLAVERGDEPDAAGIMLVGRIVEARGGEMRGVAAIGRRRSPRSWRSFLFFFRHSRESGRVQGRRARLLPLRVLPAFRAGMSGSRACIRINNSAPSCPGGPARGPSSSSPGPAACA